MEMLLSSYDLESFDVASRFTFIFPAPDKWLKTDIALRNRNSPISNTVSKLAPKNRPAVPPISAERDGH